MFGSQVDFHALDIGSVVTFPPFLSLKLGASITVSPGGGQCEDDLEWTVGERQVCSNIISECVGHGNGEKKPVRVPGDHVGLSETQLCGRVKN